MTEVDPKKAGETHLYRYREHELILFNDEVNSFDFVIESLIEVCKHDQSQAEQCALIAHHKGKCTVKNGTLPDLDPIRNELFNRGLTVSIE
jgi:ATP-dependent Clp protease adaptor protein ClpS